MDFFFRNWNNGVLIVYGAEFRIHEPFIIEISRLSMEGKKFYWERKNSDEALSIFYDKKSDWSRVKKNEDGGYNRKDLLKIWVDIAKFIVRYITLEGHYASIFSYHFTILNHLRHDKIFSIPFYLLSSLENSIHKNFENEENPVLHEGLILLVVEFSRARKVRPSPAQRNPKPLAN